MEKEDRIVSMMKSIPRDSEHLVRMLCEALVRIEDLEDKAENKDNGWYSSTDC